MRNSFFLNAFSAQNFFLFVFHLSVPFFGVHTCVCNTFYFMCGMLSIHIVTYATTFKLAYAMTGASIKGRRQAVKIIVNHFKRKAYIVQYEYDYNIHV